MNINTEACDAFTNDIQRDLTELIDAVKNQIAAHDKYDQLKKSDCNRISEMMHHFPEWEAVGTRTVSKYGRVRAWRRKADTSLDDDFIKVSEQMEIPFK